MKESIVSAIDESLIYSNFDTIEVALIDFNSNEIDTYFTTKSPVYEQGFLFDLASITKPLTLATSYLLKEDLFNDEMKLLLNHRGGLKAWGRLSRDNWQEQLLSYDIKKSPTVYSDFSALRLQLEIEKKIGQSIYDLCFSVYDKNIIHWLDLDSHNVISTGYRNKKVINGVVHDDNAYVINKKVSHAGLFGDARSLSQTLININKECSLLEKMNVVSKNRFYNGFDTVKDIESTLAGRNSSLKTFGHLGFTGTSFFIKPEEKIGFVILANETIRYWYDRSKLNDLRKKLYSEAFSL